MPAIVINRLELTVPVDEIAGTIEREFRPVFLAQSGFRRFQLVKAEERTAFVVIEGDDAATAAAGAAVIGPSLFAKHLVPVLAAEQDRHVGPAVVTIEAG
jgi:hypothetical protein